MATASLAATVAALETLRLDLLRLHAGNATLDELTQNIAAAEQVRLEIDRHLEAAREVSDLSSDRADTG
jgi:hypothetical protein